MEISPLDGKWPMRSREIQQYLAAATGRPLGEIDQRLRPLREATKITSGPRGNAAPHMSQGEALLHILAMASRRTSESLDVATLLAEHCTLIAHPEHPDLASVFKDGQRLVAFMLLVMVPNIDSSLTRDVGFRFLSFELAEDGHTAWLNFERRSLKRLRFLFSTAPRKAEEQIGNSIDAYNRFDEQFAGGKFAIGAEHLRTIGARVAMDDPSLRADDVA